MKLTAEKIAGLFGVEVEEEFLIEGNRCKVTNDGCVMRHTGINVGVVWASIAWHGIAGMEITKLPWKPKDCEKYWYPVPNEDSAIQTTFLPECKADQWRASHGLCFKTQEEAEAKWRELYGVTE